MCYSSRTLSSVHWEPSDRAGWLSAPWKACCKIDLFGFSIALLAMYQNEFATPIVRDQSERGHELRDTGLYGLVRHPFYTGFISFCAGMALWLQSYAALIVGLLPLAALIRRIYVEETILQETLPGYREYMSRTKNRIIPFIW